MLARRDPAPPLENLTASRSPPRTRRTSFTTPPSEILTASLSSPRQNSLLPFIIWFACLPFVLYALQTRVQAQQQAQKTYNPPPPTLAPHYLVDAAAARRGSRAEPPPPETPPPFVRRRGQPMAKPNYGSLAAAAAARELPRRRDRNEEGERRRRDRRKRKHAPHAYGFGRSGEVNADEQLAQVQKLESARVRLEALYARSIATPTVDEASEAYDAGALSAVERRLGALKREREGGELDARAAAAVRRKYSDYQLLHSNRSIEHRRFQLKR